jgi:hypothetical protein
MRGEAGASVPIFYSDLKPNPMARAHVREFQKSRPLLTIPILSSPAILLHSVTPANHANQAALEGDFPSARRVESMGVGHVTEGTRSGCLPPKSGTKSPSFKLCCDFCFRPDGLASISWTPNFGVIMRQEVFYGTKEEI